MRVRVLEAPSSLRLWFLDAPSSLRVWFLDAPSSLRLWFLEAPSSLRVWSPEAPSSRPLVEHVPVAGDVEQLVALLGVRQPDADQPAVAVRVVVHRLRRVDDLLVHLEHLTGERGDEIGDRFHRLHLPVRAVLRDRRADVGRLEVDELAERVLRVPR